MNMPTLQRVTDALIVAPDCTLGLLSFFVIFIFHLQEVKPSFTNLFCACVYIMPKSIVSFRN